MHHTDRHSDVILGMGVIGLILLLILPIPKILLDMLLCVSIVLSVMALLLTLYIENALEFSAFPSFLLFLTLYRLGLNIASTRMILTQAEGGDIIRTFGEFVTQNNIVVGLILFALLTLINFVVVTKGAGRVAEVAARFTLEALPGKQIAIDGELASGLITQEQAHTARAVLAQEADFFGAMDGASKFVKGDAVVGLIITCVDIIGGLVVGVFMKEISWGQCWKTFACLTVGDGLITQIPALFVSVGAGVMMTRASSGKVGAALTHQIFYHPTAILIGGITLLVLSLVPGMPARIMVPMGLGLLGWGGWRMRVEMKQPSIKRGTSHSSLIPMIEMRLGVRLRIFTEQLRHNLASLRQEMTQHLGIEIPFIHVFNEETLSEHGWSLWIRGVCISKGEGGNVLFLVSQMRQVIETHAADIVTRQEILILLQQAKQEDPSVIEELIPSKLKPGHLLKIAKNLLAEKVPIRDFRTILESLAEHVKETKEQDLEYLTECARQGLRRTIAHDFFSARTVTHAITLDPKVEQMLDLTQGILRIKAAEKFVHMLESLVADSLKEGKNPIVITSEKVRLSVRKMIERSLPQLPVLSYHEVAHDIPVEPVGIISNEILS